MHTRLCVISSLAAGKIPIHIEFLNHFAPKKSLQNAEAATKWRQTIAKSANRSPITIFFL